MSTAGKHNTENKPGGIGQIQMTFLLRLCYSDAPIVLILGKSNILGLHIINSKHFCFVFSIALQQEKS